MPDLPKEAVRAAAAAMRARYVEQFREPIKPVDEFEPDVRYIVEAAAPHLAVRREKDIRADERRKVAEQIRDLTEWRFDGGFVNLFAFVARHERLSHIDVTALSMAFEALADEIEGEARADT